MLAEETMASLGFATGFFCIYKSQIFLVTNWHVATGRNFQTKESLHFSGAIPAYFKLSFWYAHNRSNETVSPQFAIIDKFALYNECDEPIYREHPIFSNKIDVVAIPFGITISGTENNEIICIDIEKELEKKDSLEVMQPLFIVGYPLESTLTPNKFPIYKYGTIATEPYIYKDSPLFYVDGKTKKGMSGSQVVYKQELKVDIQPNEITKTEGRIDFIGIYSGRERQENTLFEAELGIVWHYKECLVPILDDYLTKFTALANKTPFYS